MAVVKNMMVRVGADFSSLVSGSAKAATAAQSWAKKTSTAVQNAVNKSKNLPKVGENATKAADGFSRAAQKIGSAGDAIKRGIGMIAGVISVGALVGFAKDAAEAASTMMATEAQFEQLFGGLGGTAKKALDEIAEASGSATSAMMPAYNKFAAYAKSMGMSTAQSVDFANRALQAAADSAAFYDRSLEDAQESVLGYVKGNFANDAALGFASTEATRGAAANREYGQSFKDLASDAQTLTLLSQIEQANLMSGAVGQAARESDSWAAITQRLTAHWREFMAVIGRGVIEIVTPWAQALDSMLSVATSFANSVAAVFSKIFGTAGADLAASASSVDTSGIGGAMEDALSGVADTAGEAAKNTSKVGDAAKKSTDDAKKAAEEATRSLLGFDKINKLSKQKDKDDDTKKDTGTDKKKTGSGAGSGAGAGAGVSGGLTDLAGDSILGQAVNQFSDLQKKLEKAMKTADFTEIGAIVGQKLKDALDSIPWDTIQTRCTKVAKSIATFLNGAIEVPGLWTSIGSTIGNALNTAFMTANTFIEEFHWDSLSKGVAEGIQSAFNTFDWGNLTEFISNTVIAGLKISKGFFQGVDWRSLPTDLYTALTEAISGIKWDEIKAALKDNLKAALSAAIDLGKGTVDLGIKLVKDGWKTVKDWLGNLPSVSQMVELAKKGWSTVTKWIGSIPGVSQAVSLTKKGWSTVTKWIGSIPGVSQTVSLAKKGWKSVSGWIGSIKPISVTINLLKGWKNSVLKALGLDNLSSTWKLKLPKVSVVWSGSPIALPKFNVSWNAKGGILNGAQLFGMVGNTLLGGGEAGREAVLPLDRNTGWMDDLADKVASRLVAPGGNAGESSQPITVNVVLDGRVVASTTVNEIKRQTLQTGVSPLRGLV